MNFHARIRCLILFVTGLLVLPLTWTHLHAQGAIGIDYIEIGSLHTSTSYPHLKLDTYAPFIGGNHVVWKDQEFEIALSGQALLTVDDKRHFTFQAPGIGLAITPNYAIDKDLRIFGSANMNYSHVRISTPLGKGTDNQFNWGIGAGLEYAMDRLSLIASADYMHFPDPDRDSSWVFGGQVNYWFDQNWGVAGGYTYLDYKNGQANRVHARVRYRF